MFHIRFSLVIAGIILVGSSYGMDCSFGTSKNFIDKAFSSCPTPIDVYKKRPYCCYNIDEEEFYCCDAEEFALKTGLGIIVPAIIAVVVIISLVVMCISCLCCTCCPWYRRRHRGTVYGNLQPPATVHIIQPQPGNPSYPTCQIPSPPPAYTATRTDLPQYPPQYAVEGYAKQAPFNPSYAQ